MPNAPAPAHIPVLLQKFEKTRESIKKTNKVDKNQITPAKNTNSKSDIQNNSVKEYYINQNSIQYPEMAVDMEIEGIVVLQAKINQKGRAEQVQIIESSSYAILDEEAMRSVATWDFNSKSHWQTIKIIFQLDKQGKTSLH